MFMCLALTFATIVAITIVPTTTKATDVDFQCMVYEGVSQNVADSVALIINHTAETYDPYNAHDNVTNNSRIYIPTGNEYNGSYLVVARITFNHNTTGVRGVQIYVNGSFKGGIYAEPTDDVESGLQLVMLQYLQTGDYVEMKGYQADGGATLGTIAFSTRTYLQVSRLTNTELLDPIAVASVNDSEIMVGDSATFYGDGVDADGTIVNYTWIINDEYFYEQNVTYQFTKSGTYKATLIVRDNSGNIDDDDVTIAVNSYTEPEPEEPITEESVTTTETYAHYVITSLFVVLGIISLAYFYYLNKSGHANYGDIVGIILIVIGLVELGTSVISHFIISIF